MAYAFNGTTQYIYGNVVYGNLPWTFAGWFTKASDGINGVVVALADTATTNAHYNCVVRITDSPNNVAASQGDASGTSLAKSEGTVTGGWHHGCALYSTSSNRFALLDGGGKVENTDSRSTDNNLLDSISIGVLRRSALANYLQGNLSEIAIWSALLTDAEVSSLAKGFRPRRIRPQSLIFYSPLIRDIKDWRGGLSLTPINSPTVANHPRVY